MTSKYLVKIFWPPSNKEFATLEEARTYEQEVKGDNPSYITKLPQTPQTIWCTCNACIWKS